MAKMHRTSWPFFLPVSAEDPDDLTSGWSMLQPLKTHGIDPGIMLVVRGGRNGFIGEAALQQQKNIGRFVTSYGNADIIVMLSNFPLAEMDWLHHAKQATDHVRAGIDFASHLPISGKKSITFHLNALCDKKEFRARSMQAWRQRFEDIRPALAALTQEAQHRECSLLVETVPVPEFGDVPPQDERVYRQTRLRDLRNPWYLTAHWGIPELKKNGLGTVLDLCHMRALLHSTHEDAEAAGIFPEDIPLLKFRTLLNEVIDLEKTDLVHLNDGRGMWKKTGGVFEEGVSLGEGDIRELPQIIQFLRKHRIPTVLEVNDQGDFTKRPASTRSLTFLQQCLAATPPLTS